GSLPEVSMGSLMAAFQDRSSEMSGMIIQAGNLIGLAALGGAVLAVLFSAPGEAIRGAIAGLFLGALLGAVLNIVLIEMQIRLSSFLFQLVVALLTWGSLTAVGGR
ncbi:MAG: hypothetical protein KC425_27490, partial [Anaerolineales bacterium]|nr:hypothetical protein [Anaerolineales bacterium]